MIPFSFSSTSVYSSLLSFFILFVFFISPNAAQILPLLILPLSLSSIYLSHSPRPTSLTLLNLPLSLSSICHSHSPQSASLTLLRSTFLTPESSSYSPTISFHFISSHCPLLFPSIPPYPDLILYHGLIFLFSSCSHFPLLFLLSV